MISQKAKLHNRFDFEIYDTETGETEYAQAENIVLNKMWNRLCSASSYFGYIGVGTGSGTLSPTRETLFSHLAYKVATAVEAVYDSVNTAHVTKKVTFSETEANGNWTEVGILYGTATGSNYATHALITDSEGNPITVNKTNTKIITVYATVFVERLAPTSGVVGPIELDYAVRLMLNLDISTLSMCASTLKTIGGGPSRLGRIGTGGYITWTSDPSNKRMYSNLIRFAVNVCNQPIRSLMVDIDSPTSTYTKVSAGAFVPPAAGSFNGHNFLGVAVGTGNGATDEFDLPKDFIRPNSEIIYVNGTPKTRGTDYAIHYGAKSTTTLLVDALPTGGLDIGEISELPQPPGAYFEPGASTITSLELKNGTASGTYKIELSTDGTNWVTAGEGSLSNSQVLTLSGFTPAKYKYIRWSGTSLWLSYFKVNGTPPVQKQIKFTTPPASGAVITADFSVDYIPKSSNFVLDAQCEILFGEGA